MSVEIDRRVVEMQFDNRDFERNVQKSLSTLEKLKMALNFDGAKGLEDITKASNKVDMSNISTQCENAAKSFSVLQVAGFTVINELTKSFLNFGKKLWNISFGQMKSGGMSRALKIEQANFQMRALAKNLDGINGDLDKTEALVSAIGQKVDEAVTGTAYGYDAAAAVAAQLMASGMTDADKMYTYLRGIAGAAAMTGRNFEDIGNIFTTIASNGKLMTMQLRQFSASGLNIAATLGQQLGKTESQITEMIRKGEIGFETFAQSMYDAFGESAGEADKTYAGVLSNVKAQLSRLGQRFAVPYMENMIPFLQQLKATIKKISSSLAPIADRFDKVFGKLTEYGASVLKHLDVYKFSIIFRGLENLAAGLVAVLKTLKDAFVEVFPKKTADQLRDAAIAFEKFTEEILPTKEALAGLKGLFMMLLTPLKLVVKIFTSVMDHAKPIAVALLKIVYSATAVFSILTNIASAIVDMIDQMGLLDSVLDAIGTAAIMAASLIYYAINGISTFIQSLANSDKFNEIINFFKNIAIIIVNFVAGAIEKVIDLIDILAGKFNANTGESQFVKNLYTIGDAIKGVIDGIHEWISVKDSAAGFKSFLEIFINIFKTIKDFIMGDDISQDINAVSNSFGNFANAIKSLGDQLKDSLENLNAGKILLFAFAISLILLINSIKSLNIHVALFVSYWTKVPNIFRTIHNMLIDIKRWIGPILFLMSFGKLINTVVSALQELTKIPQDDLSNAAFILIGVSTVIVALGMAMMLLSKSLLINGMQAEAMAILIFSVVLSLKMLIKAFNDLYSQSYELDKIADSLFIFIALLGELALAVLIFSKARILRVRDVAGLLAFAGGIYILIEAFKNLSALQIDDLTDRVLDFGKIMIAFGAALALTGALGTASFMSIFAFAISLFMLFNLLTKMINVPFDDIESAVIKTKEVTEAILPLLITMGISAKLSAGSMFSARVWSMFLAIGAVILACSYLANVIKENKYIDEAMRFITAISGLLSGVILLTSIIAFLIAFLSRNDPSSIEQLATASIFKSMASLMISIAVAILAMGAAAALISASGADTSAMWAIGIYLGMIMIFIGLLVGFSKKLGALQTVQASILQILGPFLMIMTMLTVVLAAFISLAISDTETGRIFMIAASISILFGALAILLAAFTGIMEHMGNMPQAHPENTANIGLLLLSITGLIATVVYAVNQFKNIPDIGAILWNLAGSIALILGIATLMIFRFSEISTVDYKDVFIGIGATETLILSMAPLLAAMYVFSKFPENAVTKVGTYMGILSVVLLAVFAVMLVLGAISKSEAFGGAKILAMGGSIAIACLGLAEVALALAILYNNLKDIDLDALASSISGLEIIFAILSGVLLIGSLIASGDVSFVPKVLALASAMAIMSLSFIELAHAFSMIKQSGMTADELDSYASAFGWLIGAITGLTGLIGALAPGVWMPLVAFAAVIISIGGSVYLAGAGLLFLAQAIKTFTEVSTDGISKIGKNIEEFLAQIDQIYQKLIAALPSIKATAMLIFIAIAESAGIAIGAAIASIVAFIVGILEPLLAVLLQALAVIMAAIADFLTDPEVQQIIYDLFYGLGLTAANAIIAACDGILEAIFGPAYESITSYLERKAVLDHEANMKALNSSVTQHGLSAGAEYMKSFAFAIRDGENAQEIYDALDLTLNQLDTLYGKYTSDELREAILHDWGDITNNLNDSQRELINTAIGLVNTDDYINQISTIMDRINQALEEGDTETAKLYGRLLAQGLSIGIKEGTMDAEQAWDIVVNAGFEEVVNEADIHSPSRVTEKYGKFMVDGLILGVKSKAQEFQKAFSDVVKPALNTVANLKSSMNDMFKGKTDQFANDISKSISRVAISSENRALSSTMRTGSMFKASTSDIVDTSDSYMALSESIDDTGDSVINTSESVDMAAESMDNATESTDRLGNAIERLKDAAKGAAEGFGGFLSEATGVDLSGGLGNIAADLLGIEGFKTSDEWREYGSQIVASVPDEAFQHMSDEQKERLQRWAVEGYNSLEDYVNSKSNVAEQFLSQFFDFGDATEDAKKLMDEILKDVKPDTSGLTEVDDLAKRAAERLENLKNTVKGCLDIFSEFNTEATMTGKEVLRNFMSQIEGVSDWTNMLNKLAERGLSTDIITSLEEAGPQSFAKVSAIYSMTDRELSELNALYSDSLRLADASIDSIEAGWNNITHNLMPEDLQESALEMTDILEETIESEEHDIRKVMEHYGHSAIEALRAQFKFEDAINAVKAFRDELSETLKSSLKLFDDYEEDEEIKSDKLLWNMIENTKKVGRWATNMSKLAGRGLSEGLLAELKDLGPEGSAKVEAFLRMTDDQLARANRAYESSTGLPDYAADKLASAYAKAGYYTSLGFAEGIDPEAAIAVMEQLATKSLTSLEEALDINSPSRKTYQDGVYAIQGFVLGLQDEESMTNLNDAIVLLADAIDKDFTDTLTKSRFMTIAANCLSGLKQGFNKNIKMVVDSVNTVSNAVLNTFRSKLKINSPSEEFAWCAEMCNLGFAEGMTNDTSAVTATEQKADDIFAAMYDKMYAVGLGLGSNDIFNPVITPVLNMSDVQSGFKSIKDYIGAEKFSINGTVNKAVATQNGLSKDAIAISASIDSMNARIEVLSSRMSAIGSDIEQMRYAIADGVPLYLDTGAMVGQIAGPMDKALGSRVIRAKRGKG